MYDYVKFGDKEYKINWHLYCDGCYAFNMDAFPGVSTYGRWTTQKSAYNDIKDALKNKENTYKEILETNPNDYNPYILDTFFVDYSDDKRTELTSKLLETVYDDDKYTQIQMLAIENRILTLSSVVMSDYLLKHGNTDNIIWSDQASKVMHIVMCFVECIRLSKIENDTMVDHLFPMFEIKQLLIDILHCNKGLKNEKQKR